MYHNEKLVHELQKAIMNFIEREGNRDALISVTRIELGRRGQDATVYISVFPDTKENAALHFIERNLREIRAYCGEHIRSHSIPFLRVVIDVGEKNRQRIDQLSREG